MIIRDSLDKSGSVTDVQTWKEALAQFASVMLQPNQSSIVVTFTDGEPK